MRLTRREIIREFAYMGYTPSRFGYRYVINMVRGYESSQKEVYYESR
jgi:hypothetical protein